jgi:RNA polymerase sigma-70 factor, ECF subfamily
MRKPSPHHFDAATQLLASAGIQDEPAVAAAGVYEALFRALTPIIGAAGIRALFGRSVRLSAVEFPCLAELLAAEPAEDQGRRLVDCLSTLEAPAAREVATGLIAPRLFGYLLRRTRDSARAEDNLQQTLLQIHRARGKFIQGAAVLPWAFTIARRVLADSARQGRREVLLADGDPDLALSNEPGADAVFCAQQLRRTLESKLSKLAPAQRAAFELTKGEGLTMAEAAQALGTTVTAVKLRNHRAYEALRSALCDRVA